MSYGMFLIHGFILIGAIHVMLFLGSCIFILLNRKDDVNDDY